MNKILIDNNKITSTDKTILIDNNTIKFTTSGDYEIEYINCSNINYIYDINNNNICLFEFAINQELDINNTYNINSGNLVVSKFYNNKKVKENIVINLFNDIEMPLAKVLGNMEIEGIRVDKNILKEILNNLSSSLLSLVATKPIISTTKHPNTNI